MGGALSERADDVRTVLALVRLGAGVGVHNWVRQKGAPSPKE